MKNVCPNLFALRNFFATSSVDERSLPVFCSCLFLIGAIFYGNANTVFASPQGSTSKETPDPYFNQLLKPKPTTNAIGNFAPPSVGSSDFEIELPVNNSAFETRANEASNRMFGGFDPTKKPSKGPVILPPLKTSQLWVPPLTPTQNLSNSVARTSHEFQPGSINSQVSTLSQFSPSKGGSIIREGSTDSNSFDISLARNKDREVGTPHTFSQSELANQSNKSNDFAPANFGSNDFSNSLSSNGNKPMKPAENQIADSNSPSLGSTTRSTSQSSRPDLKSNKLANNRTNVSLKTKQDDQYVSTPKRESFEPSKVLAIVGGEPIFVSDLMFEVNQVIEQFLPTAPEEVKERERKKLIPRILPKFVEGKLLYHGMLAELPQQVEIESVLEQAEAEFDDKALQPMLKNSGLKSVGEFDAHLRAQGSSLRNLRRSWARDQLTKYFLGQQLKVNTEVTHQQMLDEYRKNISQYEIKGKARWEQLMIRFDKSNSPAEAKKEVAALGDQVVYGANLAAVANKGSHGFLASSGGQHDWTSRGALVLKEIDEAIFSLPIGELSDIIATQDGYHIVRVIERTEDHHTPFLEAQVEIKKNIIEEQRQAAFDEHLAKLRKEIPVEYVSEVPSALSTETESSPGLFK